MNLLKHISIKRILIALGIIIAFIIPQTPYAGAGLLGTLIIMYVFILYAVAWNFLAYSGQGSLGHAAFLGLGAYGSVILLKKLGLESLTIGYVHVGVLSSAVLGGIFAAIIGMMIGLTCVNLRVWFLGMATFGFAIIIHTIVTELSDLTGGHDGLPTKHLIESSNFLFRYQMEYYLILVVMIVSVYLMYWVIQTRAGLAFEAIRENETEAKVMGVNIVKYKLFGFALSAFFSGLAGAMMIHHTGYLTPEIFSIDNSFKPIIYSVSGGLFSLQGSVLGTVIITALWDGLKSLGLTFEHLVIIGALLIAVVIFLPRGFISLAGKIRDWLKKRLLDT